MSARKRFYRDVTADCAGGNCRILLDGKPLRTPGGARFVLPYDGLADAVAQEWRAQGDILRPETMMLTKLANTAIDRVANNRGGVIAQILAFARSDLLCYRAAAPRSLVERQAAVWHPLIAWAAERYGAALHACTGIAYVEQRRESLDAVERALAAQDDCSLAGLQAASALLGSAIIALALAEGRLEAAEAIAAADLDETYQAEKWGNDEEAKLRASRRAAELADIARFLSLSRPERGLP